MPRPRVIVNVTTSLPPRNAPSSTGVAMLAFTGGTPVSATLANPLQVTTPDQVTAAYGASDTTVQTLATYVQDLMANGASVVYLARAAAAPATAADWTAVLNLFTGDFGLVAQVAIPGQPNDAARDALAAHAATYPTRTVFLDVPDPVLTGTPDTSSTYAAKLQAVATKYATAAAAARIGVVGPNLVMAAAGGGTRITPASVIAMGLTARGDARVGHANNAPAGDQQGAGAGVIVGAVGPTISLATSDLDSLDDGGVSCVRYERNLPTLMGWVSVSTDARFHQLNVGRFIAQITAGVRQLGFQFLFTPLDKSTFVAFEAALRSYLDPLRVARALWTGLDGSKDGYDVVVAPLNTLATIQAAQLVSAVTLSITPYAHDITLQVTTSVATNVPA